MKVNHKGLVLTIAAVVFVPVAVLVATSVTRWNPRADESSVSGACVLGVSEAKGVEGCERGKYRGVEYSCYDGSQGKYVAQKGCYQLKTLRRLADRVCRGWSSKVCAQPTPSAVPTTPSEMGEETTVELPLLSDTYINAWSSGSNYDRARVLSLRASNQTEVMSVLMKFDLSGIPAGAVVDSARLSFKVIGRSNSQPVTVRLGVMEKDWQATEVNWLQAAKGVPFEKPGAQGAGDRTNVAGGQISKMGAVEMDVGSVVNNWLAHGNRGMMLSVASQGRVRYAIGSSESPNVADRPKLVVRYRAPVAKLDFDTAIQFHNSQSSPVGQISFVKLLPKGDSLNLSFPQTIEFWVKPERKNAPVTSYIWFRVLDRVKDAFNFSPMDVDVSYRLNDNILATARQLPTDKWSHVAVSIEADGTARYYANGRLVGQKKLSLSQKQRPGVSQVGIGGYAGMPQKLGFVGQLDEFRISRVARYRGQTIAVPTEPFVTDAETVALYHFDDGAKDSSGQGNNGELVGAFSFVRSTVAEEAGPQPTPSTSSTVTDKYTGEYYDVQVVSQVFVADRAGRPGPVYGTQTEFDVHGARVAQLNGLYAKLQRENQGDTNRFQLQLNNDGTYPRFKSPRVDLSMNNCIDFHSDGSYSRETYVGTVCFNNLFVVPGNSTTAISSPNANTRVQFVYRGSKTSVVQSLSTMFDKYRSNPAGQNGPHQGFTRVNYFTIDSTKSSLADFKDVTVLLDAVTTGLDNQVVGDLCYNSSKTKYVKQATAPLPEGGNNFKVTRRGSGGCSYEYDYHAFVPFFLSLYMDGLDVVARD